MQQLAETLREMLGPDIGVGISDPRDATLGLLPAETACIPRAVPTRRASFAAGRRAARAAMDTLGLSPAAIPQGPTGAPRWPPGITGTITHCDTACLAAVMRTEGRATLGIDLEPATPLDTDLISIICTKAEQRWLATQPSPGLAAKRIFCAKEAIYKAQFPITGQVIGFDAVTLTWNGPSFGASPLPGVPPLGGQCAMIDGFILTACQPQKVTA